MGHKTKSYHGEVDEADGEIEAYWALQGFMQDLINDFEPDDLEYDEYGEPTISGMNDE